ncbi:MAG: N-acetylmuramoyl-L-alanine amidase [Candidatus Zixiibacteriota bacterium]|nr:MAG: N-acetylmuramoyl-L-alanine amidase [candidate division Zixibacteria bacterium]
MLCKSTFLSKLLVIISTLVIAAPAMASDTLKPDGINDPGARIKIVYPKPDQIVSAVDSTFILGNVPAASEDLAYRLFINDHYVSAHEDGGFIAFLPVTPGFFEFRLDAFLVDKDRFTDLTSANTISDIPSLYIKRTLTEAMTVYIPEPLLPLTMDSTLFDREIRPPSGPLVLSKGDRLAVSFRGTPWRKAWFSIPGVADSVPMSETSPMEQLYWGEAVFGAGAVPDSLKIEGIYSGFYDIPRDVSCDSIHIQYHLAPLPHFEMYDRAIKENFILLDSSDFWGPLRPFGWGDTARLDTISSYAVTINSPEFPFTVRFTDSVQVLRYGPLKGYFSIFQPEGVEALAVGGEGDWYRIQLSKNQFAWAAMQSVEALPKGILPPSSYIKSVRSYDEHDHLLFEFPLTGKHPFRVYEDDRRNIRVQLFGVTSNTDWIRYDFNSDLIDLTSWSQPEEGVWEFTLSLTQDIWGYDSYYQGNTFFLKINKPPEDIKNWRGKRVVIDPGHSSDKGAIGPTGYTEAEANLHIALAVRDELQDKGATVIMTRDDDSHVDLYERPVIAKLTDADLFVSIHNNALPDGVNPFDNSGTSIYYYHPHSIDLARAIHREMLDELDLPDFGLYHGNLAVNRPTQYPAVLVECAFIIIPEQEAMIKTDKFRKKVAKAITKGIDQFLERYHDNNR